VISIADAQTEQFSGGLFGLAALVLGIFWLIFPFIVISKFNELIKVEKEIIRYLHAMWTDKKQAPPPLSKEPQPTAATTTKSEPYRI
jgi:hypothetical protein